MDKNKGDIDQLIVQTNEVTAKVDSASEGSKTLTSMLVNHLNSYHMDQKRSHDSQSD